jgi:hypothetical protein
MVDIAHALKKRYKQKAEPLWTVLLFDLTSAAPDVQIQHIGCGDNYAMYSPL